MKQTLPRFANLRSQAELDAEGRRARSHAATLLVAHAVAYLGAFFVLAMTIAVLLPLVHYQLPLAGLLAK